MNDIWINRFMNLAKEVSTWSKDPSSQIGAIAVDDNRQILSVGYNGFPRGMDDSSELYEDREKKYSRIVHAEMNLIYNATHNGVSLKDSSVFVYGLWVCSECAKGLIQVGVKNIYMKPTSINKLEKWQEEFEKTKTYLNEIPINYYEY